MPYRELDLSVLALIDRTKPAGKPILNCDQRINTTENALVLSIPLTMLNGDTIELSIDIIYDNNTGKTTSKKAVYLWAKT